MGMGSVWLPVVVCLAMMAIGCAGLLLLGRLQRARRRPRQAPPLVTSRLAASADGRKERADG